MGALSNAPPAETQHHGRHRFVHCDTAIAATDNMAQDAHFNIVHTIGRSNDRKLHAIGCEYLRIDVEGGQLPITCSFGIHRALRNQCITARNGKPQWSMKAFVRIVCEIEYHDVVWSGIFADKFRDKGPRKWTNQVFKTLGEATESYMVEVIAESSLWKQKPIS